MSRRKWPETSSPMSSSVVEVPLPGVARLRRHARQMEASLVRCPLTFTGPMRVSSVGSRRRYMDTALATRGRPQ